MEAKMSKREYHSTVGWRKYFDLNHSPRVERFLKANGLIIFNQLLENIEEAVENKIEEVLILAHKNAGSIVCVKEKDYKEVLEHSMKWFLQGEHYEQCGRIKSLLDNMKPKKSKTKKIVSVEI
jgi:hypothetical protein